MWGIEEEAVALKTLGKISTNFSFLGLSFIPCQIRGLDLVFPKVSSSSDMLGFYD